MSTGDGDRFFEHFGRHYQHWKFTHSMEAMDAKAEVLMADSIAAMHQIANGLVEYDEPPITMLERRAACIKLCADTFDRLERENGRWAASLSDKKSGGKIGR